MSFPDPLGLFSSSSSRLSLPSPGQLLQSLRSGFGQTMQAMPSQQAQSMFPSANLGAGNTGTAGNHGHAGHAGHPGNAGNAGAGSGPPALPLPGGGSIAPPPLPPWPNSAAPGAGMQGNGGVFGAANNLLGAVGNTVSSLLNPRAAAPVNVPNPPSPTAGGPPTAPTTSLPPSTGVASNVLATANNVVRTVLPGAVTPQAGTQAPLAAGLQAPQSAPLQQAAVAQPTMAGTPGQTSPAQQAPATAPQSQALPQQAGQAALPQQAAPTLAQRADAAFAPTGNPAADRAALAQQAPLPSQPALNTAPVAATLLAAVPMATTVAQAPVAQQIAGNPQAQAPGGPVAGTAALDAGGPVRAELTGTGTYTADGPGLRRRERMKVGAQQMGQWMLAIAQGRLHLVRPHDDSRHEAERVFQWLFWVLAIVAYGSLGLVLVAFLLSFGELPAAPTLRRWTGEFAFAGLLAAGGAWWLGRQLTRAPRPPPDPIRR